jgi:AraC-like DNA-binding protein
MPPFRLATAELPERDRVAIWREEFARTIFKLDWEPVPDGPFFQTATLRRLPGLSMIAADGTGFRNSRTQRHIADDVNDTVVHIHLGGGVRFSQLGREEWLHAGQATLISGEDSAEAFFPGPFRALCMAVPRKSLLERLPDGKNAFMRLISRENEALRLLTGYLSLLDSADIQMGPDSGLGPAFVNHIHDLCVLALGPGRDATEQAQAGLKASRLHAVKRDILAHLGESDLSASAIAARNGITPRYLRRLFEPEGITFSEFLLSVRLKRAKRLLAYPRFGGRTIASIAYDAGFADLSYFNRAFRKRFGMTPSDARAAAKRERGEK